MADANNEKILTAKMKQDYLKNNGGRCPFCGSAELDTHHLNSDGSEISEEVECQKCFSIWIDIYKLSEIIASKWADYYQEF